LVTAKYYFAFGLVPGIKRALENLKIAFGMIKAGRMSLGVPKKIKDRKSLKAILGKAAEIEARTGGN
jgi:quinone-modifying oxidoreductase subunit QmoC